MQLYNYSLSSTYTPAENGETDSFELQLTNEFRVPLSGFSLGISGPGRIGVGAELAGGTIVDQLGTWCEIAAPKGLTLPPGWIWKVGASILDFDLKHWTDGTTGAMLKLANGSVLDPVHVKRGLSQAETVCNRAEVMDISEAGDEQQTVCVIPWPLHVQVNGMRTAPEGLTILAHCETEICAKESFSNLVAHLFPGEGLVRSAEEGGYPVTLKTKFGYGDEAYSIGIESGGAWVEATTATGHLYGLITLAQMARGARRDPQRFSFPATGSIEDQPNYGWRGCHWDVARRFYASGEIAQFLRILAWNKLNRFHWHLSDDEAWRVEIDAYPDLTRKSAWRGYGMALPPLVGSGPEKSGGYYTKAAVRDLIALAGSIGVEVVPEIDLPGHCHALLVALPHLRDPQENGLYYSIQNFSNNCVNPALPQVQIAIETILAELCDLFPSPYFHVGADEVPKDAWAGSPRAMAALKVKDSQEMAVLQADFLSRIQTFLSKRGKITGAWEEAAHGGGIDKKNCYLVGWQTVQSGRTLAAEGYDVVVAPAQAYYLDMANGPEWAEPDASWAGCSSPENTYCFDPAAGWTDEEKLQLKGVQACMWNEPMTDRGAFQRLVFPRLSAIAETGWTKHENKKWRRFANCAHLMPSLYPI